MDEREERIRAADAEQLLRHPLLVEALETIEANIVNQLGNKDVSPERVTYLHHLLVGKRAFERYLTQLVTTGRMADLAEQQRRSFADRVRSMVR